MTPPARGPEDRAVDPSGSFAPLPTAPGLAMPRSAHGSTAGATDSAADPDFAADVLADLYAYQPKRRWLAFLLWFTLGWAGGHRYYLERPGTGLLMLLTGGGALFWWAIDGFLIRGMVASHNAEQERRRRAGLPPLELAFMPALARDVLAAPPAWTVLRQQRSRFRRRLRFAADIVVLVVSGVGLGAVARRLDVWEAVLAVFVLVALCFAGSAVGRFGHLPVVRGLIRWSHRLRLFYYFNKPGNPLALLIRPVTAPLLAPFRRRDKAEVRLYLQLGAVFTVAFLLLDFGADVFAVLFGGGRGPGVMGLVGLWLREAVVTFVVIFAFATPIGAVLTLYLLVRRTHTVPRVLSVIAAAAILWGLLI
jgi:hypothetical protein